MLFLTLIMSHFAIGGPPSWGAVSATYTPGPHPGSGYCKLVFLEFLWYVVLIQKIAFTGHNHDLSDINNLNPFAPGDFAIKRVLKL